VLIILLVLACAAVITVCYFFTEPINKLIKVISKKNKGDMQVRVTVATPTDLTAEQKELLKQFGEMYVEKRSTVGPKKEEKAEKEGKGESKSKGFFNKNKK